MLNLLLAFVSLAFAGPRQSRPPSVALPEAPAATPYLGLRPLPGVPPAGASADAPAPASIPALPAPLPQAPKGAEPYQGLRPLPGVPPAAAPAPAKSLGEAARELAPALEAAGNSKTPAEFAAHAAEGAFAALQGVRVTPITGRIIHLEFESHRALATTFMRFQEHYESPKFRGKVFSREQYEDWYASTHGGKFSYVEDWGGFNIPSRVLRRFYQGEFDPLTDREKAFLELFRGMKGRFYVIGTSRAKGADAETIRHETAHGLFYSSPSYKKAALAILAKVDLKQVFAFLAQDQGYHRSVFLDEAHAYLLGDLDWLSRQGVNVRPLRGAARKLRKLFTRHAPAGVR